MKAQALTEDLQTPRNRPLLSIDECRRVRRTVEELRGRWLQRSPTTPFYTLGTASYLDAIDGRFDAYSERARFENAILWHHFDWLFERLASAIAKEVGIPVEYDPRLALPGFHIF